MTKRFRSKAMIAMTLKQLIRLLDYTNYSGKIWLDIVNSGNVYELDEVEDDELLYAEVVGIDLQPDYITISVVEEP